MKFYRAFVVGVLATLAFPVAASAQSATCTEAYERAQEKRSEGHLSAALSELRVCVESTCAEFVREDCKRWLNQTEAELPTVVFSVTRNGKDEAASEISCDGVPLAGVLDGKAVPIDPGFHLFTVKIPGSSPIERKLLIRDGERNRILEFAFLSSVEDRTALPPVVSQPLPVPPAHEGSRRRAILTYGLSGVGVLGLAGFSLFAALGRSEKADLQHSCAPFCSENQIDKVRTKYLIADTCLGVGLVSLGVATYLYITGRGKGSGTQEGSTASVDFVAHPAGAGGVLRLSSPF